MEIENSISDFASWIADIIRFEVEENEESFIFTPRCIDPNDHKFFKFGKLYRARQVLSSLLLEKAVDERS